jgi:lactoylglutathione lyase
MQFGYTILYVPDVIATLAFYEKAFGFKIKFIPESKQYGELDTGSTTLAFVSEAFIEQNGMRFRRNRPKELPAAFEIAFVIQDVAAAYQHAIASGATADTPPKTTPWGQTIAYVRDLNGVIVELCSPIA